MRSAPAAVDERPDDDVERRRCPRREVHLELDPTVVCGGDHGLDRSITVAVAPVVAVVAVAITGVVPVARPRDDAHADASLEPGRTASRNVAKLEPAAAHPSAEVAPLPALMANLGDVGEVGVDLEAEAAGPGQGRVVSDRPAVAQARPDDPMELQLDGILGQLRALRPAPIASERQPVSDRKSTRLNSSHGYISYA